MQNFNKFILFVIIATFTPSTNSSDKQKYIEEILNAEPYQIPVQEIKTYIGYNNLTVETYKIYKVNLNKITEDVEFHIYQNGNKPCTCSIERLYIHQAFQKCGIGTKLLDVITDVAKSKGCNKMELYSVTNAIPFYEKNGFNKKALQKNNMEKYI